MQPHVATGALSGASVAEGTFPRNSNPCLPTNWFRRDNPSSLDSSRQPCLRTNTAFEKTRIRNPRNLTPLFRSRCRRIILSIELGLWCTASQMWSITRGSETHTRRESAELGVASSGCPGWKPGARSLHGAPSEVGVSRRCG
jgi:hypothetical protein